MTRRPSPSSPFRARSARALLAIVAGAQLGAAEPKQVSEILLLSAEQTRARLPVVTRGTVTFVEPDLVFFQDQTAGTYFHPPANVVLRPGDRIVVEGRAEPGIYLPGLESVRVEVVGHGAPPPAVNATYDDLLSGRFHYQRIALQGLVRAVTALSETRSLVRLAVGSRLMDVWVEASFEKDRPWVDSLVRVQGLAVGTINSRGQLVQPYVRVAGWTDIEVLRAAPPEGAVPRIAATELLTYAGPRQGSGRVRLNGTVTAVFARGMLYLRGEHAAFSARLATPLPVQVGDQVEVMGFPEMGRFTAALGDAQLVSQRAGSAPEPVRLRIEDLFRGSYDSDLVQVTARVTDVFRSERDSTLVLQEGERRLRVVIYSAYSEVDVPVGGVIRATGVSRVNISEGVGYSSQPEVIALYTRSAGDIEVVRRPPWWTVQRLALVSAVLLGIMLLGALWIALLRRQVRRQAAAARGRIETEVALEERNRLARDFHDTLEQELVGLGLRLDAIPTHDLDEKRRGLIGASRDLVSRIQAETRNLVGDLRSERGRLDDLRAALGDLLELNSPESATAVTIDVAPDIPLLPFSVVHNLRMIARESVTNALKHAHAATVEVRVVRTAAEALRLSIADDGRGFDPARETRGKTGHYGCVGIRERCAKLGATVTWRSAGGRGTTVEVEMPLPATTRPGGAGRQPAGAAVSANAVAGVTLTDPER